MTSPLHGKHFIAGRISAVNQGAIHARNPETGERLEPAFPEATSDEVNRAVEAAADAFESRPTPEVRARLLEAIGEEIERLGDALIDRVRAETGLPEARVRGERGRTIGQLRMFADLVREGSWVDARIDHARIDRAQPERTPAPRPDLRRMLIPLGPVAVFGASNFPLAFSVAGGDTASALAAGCPVVVKAHPAHPGTSEMVASAISEAVNSVGVHPGFFSLLHGARPETSIALVQHEHIQAVGFTGSLRAGRALFDAAAARPIPIPVYAEMGSTNPVFVLPRALRDRGREIAQGLSTSVTLGGGQFCTNPGMVIGLADGQLERFSQDLADLIGRMPACTLLHEGIQAGYDEGLRSLERTGAVRVLARSTLNGSSATAARAAVLGTDAHSVIAHPRLREEVFGPSTLIVNCAGRDEMLQIARTMDGNLTASLHGSPEDLEEFADLVRILENKVGRIIFNGFPTGVEVSPAMQHGGPYPATTDVRTTSVGTAAILRFARPICYQNFPDASLPPELRNRNERGIWRLVDGEQTRSDIG